MTKAADAARRVTDIAVSVVGLTLTSPIIAMSAIAVRLRMGQGVLFRQERLGRGGHPFRMVKMRTMRHPVAGRSESSFDGERLGTFGRWLRATSIDELPTLVNLLRGDMTLVGPRPLPSNYWPRYRGDEYRRFEVKPGITGLAQISGRNAVDWPQRLALDVRYVETRTLIGDVRILLATVPVVLRRHGIDEGTGTTMTPLPVDR